MQDTVKQREREQAFCVGEMKKNINIAAAPHQSREEQNTQHTQCVDT